jgi:immune inhibitor A
MSPARAAVLLAVLAVRARAMPPLVGPGGRPVATIRWPGLVQAPEPVRPTTDDAREVLLLLVDFPDNTARHDTAAFRQALFTAGNNSIVDYYDEASFGNLALAGALSGWHRAAYGFEHYLGDSFGIFGDYPHNSQGLVVDLVRQADPFVDFARYDRDDDGVVDGLWVMHAGPGAEETGNPRHIWSHKWQLSDPTFGSPGPVQTNDGVSVDVYSVQPERFEDNEIMSIGVFCHEFGHILGLPDLYDTDYSSSGLGRFCLMAGGSWGQATDGTPGSSPVHPCAWCKYLLGWVRPESLEQGLVDSLPGADIPTAATAPAAYRLVRNPAGVDWGRGGTGIGEYFLVENRQRTGFDAGLPGAGLLILHVDESQASNDDERRPLVGILRADGSPSLALPADDRGSDAHLWKASDSGVSPYTVPGTMFHDGVQSGVAATNISASGLVMQADLEIGPLFLGTVYSCPNPVVVREGTEHATIVYEPSDDRLAGRFPDFTVTIFDIAADRVRVLDRGEEVNPGHRAAFWDLRDDSGRPVGTGMYFYVVRIEDSGVVERSRGRLTIVR